MGVAIIVPDANFSSANLGKVTLTDDVPVRALSIISPETISGESYQLGVSYYPINTNQRNVNWSIESGGEYASINSTTGLLTIKNGAKNSMITIKAVSASNSSIYNTIGISVSYVGGVTNTYVMSITPSANNALTSNESYSTGLNANEFNHKTLNRLGSTKLLDPNAIVEVYSNGVNPKDAGGSIGEACPAIFYFSSDVVSKETLVGVQYVNENDPIAYEPAKIRMGKITPIVPAGAKYAIVVCNTAAIISIPEGGYYLKTKEVL